MQDQSELRVVTSCVTTRDGEMGHAITPLDGSGGPGGESLQLSITAICHTRISEPTRPEGLQTTRPLELEDRQQIFNL